jgi:hypothetical protein
VLLLGADGLVLVGSGAVPEASKDRVAFIFSVKHSWQVCSGASEDNAVTVKILQ